MSLSKRIPPWLWLILIGIYLLSPIDIIPDYFGLPARIDDLLVALWGLYYVYANSRTNPGAGRSPGGGSRVGQGETRGKGPQEPGHRSHRGQAGSPGSDGPAGKAGHVLRDHYQVLGVTKGTPMADIRHHYRDLVLQYHPDRVQHLGKELQKLAEEKTREINKAYQEIKKEREGEA